MKKVLIPVTFLFNIVSNQDNKRLQEVHRERTSNKARIIFNKLVEGIPHLFLDEQVETFRNYINNYKLMFPDDTDLHYSLDIMLMNRQRQLNREIK